MVKLITISKTVKDLDYQLWSYDSHMKITFFDNSCQKKTCKKKVLIVQNRLKEGKLENVSFFNLNSVFLFGFPALFQENKNVNGERRMGKKLCNLCFLA